MSIVSQRAVQMLLDPIARQCREEDPLCCIAEVKRRLGASEDEVIELINMGQLAWAFDVSCPGAKAREVRIWAGSVQDYLEGGKARVESLDNVIRDILPKHRRPALRATELMRALNCSQLHIYNLIEAKQFDLVDPNPAVAGQAWRPGPGGSAQLTRTSAASFLKRRKV